LQRPGVGDTEGHTPLFRHRSDRRGVANEGRTILEHDIAAAISEVMVAKEKRPSEKPGEKPRRTESQDC